MKIEIKRQAAFSLIEVMIAVIIASMLSMVLYQVFNQTQRLVRQVQGLIDDYDEILPLYNQFEQDVSGATIITSTHQSKPGEKSEPEYFFVASNQDNRFKELHLVTTHALQSYDQVVPQCTRVVYKLVAEQAELEQKRFILTRQEIAISPEKQIENKKQGRAYPLLKNIVDLKMDFIIRDTAKQELLHFSSWGTAEQRKRIKAQLPEFVSIQATLVDPIRLKEFPLTISFALPTSSCINGEVTKALPVNKKPAIVQAKVKV